MDPSISTGRSAMCDPSRGRQEAAPDEGRQAQTLVAPKEEPPESANSGGDTAVVSTRLPGETQVSGRNGAKSDDSWTMEHGPQSSYDSGTRREEAIRAEDGAMEPGPPSGSQSHGVKQEMSTATLGGIMEHGPPRLETSEMTVRRLAGGRRERGCWLGAPRRPRACKATSREGGPRTALAAVQRKRALPCGCRGAVASSCR